MPTRRSSGRANARRYLVILKSNLKRNITITLGVLFVLLLILLRLGWGEFFIWQFDLVRGWELRVQADIPPYSIELVQEPGFDFYNSYFLIKRNDGKTAFVLIDGDESIGRINGLLKVDTLADSIDWAC